MQQLTSGSKVLVLGSGGLCIGQAGEFDYSGSQAIKALKDEGFVTILVNPNIATVQTDEELADHLYLQPLNQDTVCRIIDKERPDAILLGFGGQTALNLGLSLNDSGILEKYGIKVLGTPIETIRITEDRLLFKKALSDVHIKTPRSFAATSVEAALEAAEQIGYPLMMRSGYSLGGLGSGRIQNSKELREKAQGALSHTSQILIEEYLHGWKEVEYELIRDSQGNAIAVCNMENFDPMGIHTGESIVVAPSQTLTNKEYFSLREIAIKAVHHLGIVGECNIQYALHPVSGEYRVVEMNARLSRSSALASKATGYPLAYVAAKIAIGFGLSELKNIVTKTTSAFFEPAMDYVVVKIPRWDIHKFKSASRVIGSEMKSVGEVMSIGRSFPEAIQKAIRMLNIGMSGISDYPAQIEHLEREIGYSHPTDRRLFAIYQYFQKGGSVEEVHSLSLIDPWFLHPLMNIAKMEEALKRARSLSSDLLLEAKKLGFSDQTIGKLQNIEEKTVREIRIGFGICPFVKQIDTMAGEFAAETNYLYMTYHGQESDIASSLEKPTLVIGSGPYCIGSSVEFDWCAVNCLRSLKRLGETTVMINSNPETVSTDYDESDRLYFEELTKERVADIADFENPKGLIISFGGQIANNLASPLEQMGYPIMGTPVASIDCAENRRTFSSLLNKLGIDQPAWTEVKSSSEAKAFAHEVGYPILVRPSYVLSGSAMNVIYNNDTLEDYLEEALISSRGYPVVCSKFIENAKELEIDGVAQDGKIVVQAISEHIENAGIHSGDASIVLPPQRIYLETVRRAKNITKEIVRTLAITGPFNIQFLAKDNVVNVIECNVRASRLFPFVSKVIRHNLVDTSIRCILKAPVTQNSETLELDYVGVKMSQFSFNRLKGTNPVSHVEMASTGEVGCLGDSFHETFMRAWQSTGQSIHGKRLLLSIGGESKIKLQPLIRRLDAEGWDLYTTEGTHDYLAREGIASKILFKASESLEPNIKGAISKRQIDLIVNIPNRAYNPKAQTDGFTIRRLAIDHNIPLITNLQFALFFIECLLEIDLNKTPIKTWKEYVHHS